MKEKLLRFLCEIDKDFPIKLSEKTDLNLLAEKFCSLGEVGYIKTEDRIVAAVCGYMNDMETKEAYISVVGTLREYRGRGHAQELIEEFIEKSKISGMKSVKLHTRNSNFGAIRLYEKLGFVKVECDRVGDICFRKEL